MAGLVAMTKLAKGDCGNDSLGVAELIPAKMSQEAADQYAGTNSESRKHEEEMRRT